IASVADFLATGISLGEATIVIATAAHRAGFRAALAGRGVSLEDAERTGQCLCLDAEETLAKFLSDGMPDWEKFRATVGPVIAAMAGNEGRPVRAYGEMVDLLWRAGNAEASIRLEQLWNALAGEQRFSLLCAYVMGGLYQRVGGHSFDDVCRTHSHVIPAPSYARLRAEITQRKNLERALRDSLKELNTAKERVAQLQGERPEGKSVGATPERRSRASDDVLGTVREIGLLAQQMLTHPDETVAFAAEQIVSRAQGITEALETLCSSQVPSEPRAGVSRSD
ncbi:MAG TPA: MEDS domain-containing protein, partial [Polyangia bacterium]